MANVCYYHSVLCLINKHVGKAKTSFGFYAAAELSQSRLSSHHSYSSQHFSLLKKALKGLHGLVLMSSSEYKKDSYP